MTLEWAALEMVRVDTLGFIQYFKDRCEDRPSLLERVEDELKSISILVSECLVDYTSQSEWVQSKINGLGIDEEDWSSTERVSGGSVCACMRTNSFVLGIMQL